jgi:hypothetical protein
MQYAGKRLLFVATILIATGVTASAQQYPSQDIHFICAFPAGSGATCWCAILQRRFARSPAARSWWKTRSAMPA